MTPAADTLWDVFRRALLVGGDRPALAFGARSWSYRELAGVVTGAAARLLAAGVEPGDRVLLLMDNGPAFPVHDLAVMAVGGVKVPLNAQLTPAEVAGIAERVRPRAAVVSDALRGHVAGVPAGTVVLDDSLPAGDPAALPPIGAAAPDDAAVIYFTGGTTGQPKGVVHTQAATVVNLWAHILEAGIARDERLLLTTPLAHAAGLFTLTGLLRGAFVRIEAGFDAERVIDRIDSDRTTWTFAVPTMIYRILAVAEKRDWRSTTLRTLQYGAAPIAADQASRALERLGPVLQQLYAQTECPNFATVLRKEDHERAELLGSCGRPSIMCDVSIMDDDGAELKPGAIGEVCLRSPYVMSGYWQEDAGIRFHGPWLRTGDIGYVDADGYLFLVDRRNDMIVSGGMNVYSIEVEQALLRHPGVAAAAVVGVPHADWGEAVHAVVVLADGAGSPDLTAHCRTELAGYKRPKSYAVVADLPLTRYGKVDKKALRAPYWSDRDRAIG